MSVYLVCLSVCVYVSLFVYLSVYLLFCMSVCPFIYICRPICLSVCMSVCLCVCLAECLSLFCIFFYLSAVYMFESIQISFYPSVCMSVFKILFLPISVCQFTDLSILVDINPFIYLIIPVTILKSITIPLLAVPKFACLFIASPYLRLPNIITPLKLKQL